MRVKNGKTIGILTRRSLKAAKFRNIVAVCAIALTAILFTSVFAIGGNIIASLQNATMRQVGTSAHGGLKFLTQPQYDNLKESPLIKDISYNIIIAIAENEALQKKQTEIRYSEDKAARWGFNYPTVGNMPRSGKELACSTITLDMLGIPHELGQTVPLEFSIGGQKFAEEFTLCGFWPGDDVMTATQVWLSREYTDSIISVPLETDWTQEHTMDDLMGTINADVWFSNSLNIEAKLDALIAEAGYSPGEIRIGVNWAYMGGSIDPTAALMMIFLLLLILASGYLIIYSVFAISVSGDIRFYGLLKTIGATGRQLKAIVRNQALFLSLMGIPLGLIIGWLLGYALTPVVMNMTNLRDDITASANPLIFIFAAAFSLLTVYISIKKPGRIAARVSPIEAVRYTDANTGRRKGKQKRALRVSPVSMAWANIWRNPGKLAIVVLSLSLSLILLNSVYSIVQGFDMEEYLKNQMLSDFSVADYSVYSAVSAQDNFEGVDNRVLAGIAALPGLEAASNIYFADHIHQLTPTGRQNMEIALDFLTPRIEKNFPHGLRQVAETRETGVVPMHVYAAGEMGIDIIAQDILAQNIDYEQLASGDYALISRISVDYDNESPSIYNVGEKIPLVNGEGETREFEVIGILSYYPYAISCQHGHMIESDMVLAENVYLDFFGPKQPMMTIFDVEEANIPTAEEWLQSYCESIDTSLDYRSREFYKEEFNNMRLTFYGLGGALAFILALIGLLNFINTVFTSIFSRRRELAMLQSVGLTGRQLQTLLFSEGAAQAGLTLLFTSTFGTLISMFIVRALAGDIWFFRWTFTPLPLLCAVIPLLLICAVLPLICYRFMRKESLVERIRME